MSAPATVQLPGARKEARPSVLRRLLSGAVARDLTAFVIPGPDVARARGLDLGAAGLRVAETSRHAGVLVLIGALPPGLRRTAAVAYAQMPRPRVVLAVGATDASPLPAPDVSVAASQDDLSLGVEEIGRLLKEGAFTGDPPAFHACETTTKTKFVCPMHPEVKNDDPGSCPKCGMDLVPREAAPGREDRGDGDHAPHGEQGSHDEAGSADRGGESRDHEHAGEHGGHGGMDHGDGMGFMSMVETTRGTPRSGDGLQMEWTEVPFGPYFPGLPGGLSLVFTLDGDTVAGAKTLPVVGDFGGLDGTPVRDLHGRISVLDPLSPVAYRVLVARALEDATGAEAGEETALARAGALERERVASHLGWLSGIGHLLGYPWLATRAGRLQVALVWTTDADGFARLEPEVRGLLRTISRVPLLARRLRNVGTLPDGAETRGPVARASGLARDARGGEEIYTHLGFEPVVHEGKDALARFRTRSAEVEQSLGLARKAGVASLPERVFDGDVFGRGQATVETPRGAATLKITAKDGLVVGHELDAPSAVHLGRVAEVAEGRELADALVGVASLDLSPWGATL